MVRSRVSGILAGYEDQNDHDTLRADPVFKLVADRSRNESDLASQPTLSRFENAIAMRHANTTRSSSLRCIPKRGKGGGVPSRALLAEVRGQRPWRGRLN